MGTETLSLAPATLHDPVATAAVFAAAPSARDSASADPAVKTHAKSLSLHGDAIMQMAKADLHRAAEAQRYARYYRNVGRGVDADQESIQAKALLARGKDRLAEATKLHEQAKLARTLIERFGPLAWKAFIGLSVVSMVWGMIGAMASLKRLEKIQRDAAKAASAAQA